MVDDPEVLRVLAARMSTTAPRAAGFLNRMAHDIDNGGPVVEVLRRHRDAGSPLFAVRALAGVQRLMASGKIPQFREHFERVRPADHDALGAASLWELFIDAVVRFPEEISAALDCPVQQHEPRRAAHLLRGLTILNAPKVRLLEIGACAGLNLNLDRYRWFGPGWEWGDPQSPVRLPAYGPQPGTISIVDRAGCDLAPRNPANPTDAAAIRSFLPCEDEFGHEDLDKALDLTAAGGVRVDRGEAVAWLTEQLSRPADRSVVTVVWHSLLWCFLTPADQEGIEHLLAKASRHASLVRIAFEPGTWLGHPRLQLNVYS